MKKVCFTTLFIILCFTYPVASSLLDIRGSLETEVVYERPRLEETGNITGQSRLNLNMSINTANAHIVFKDVGSVTKSFDGSPWKGQLFSGLSIDRASMFITGPYWKDGIEVTTVLGDYWLQSFASQSGAWRQGFSIEDININESIRSSIHWYPNVFINRLALNERSLSVEIDTKFEKGEVFHAGSLYYYPISELVLRGTFNSVNDSYKLMMSAQPVDILNIKGEIDYRGQYDIGGAINYFNRLRLNGGYKKEDGSIPAFYIQLDTILNDHNMQVRYDDATGNIRATVGVGTLYKSVAQIKDLRIPDVFAHDYRMSRKGYAVINSLKSGRSSWAFVSALDINEKYINNSSSSISFRSDIRAEYSDERIRVSQSKIGFVSVQKLSYAGFEGIRFSGSLTYDFLKSSDPAEIALRAEYQAPNGLLFVGEHKPDSHIMIKGSKRIEF